MNHFERYPGRFWQKVEFHQLEGSHLISKKSFFEKNICQYGKALPIPYPLKMREKQTFSGVLRNIKRFLTFRDHPLSRCTKLSEKLTFLSL